MKRMILGFVVMTMGIMLAGCGSGGSDNNTSNIYNSFYIVLGLSSITDTTIDLVLTANYIGSNPVYIDGQKTITVSYEPNTPKHITFPNVGNIRHCYQVGNRDVTPGSISSNILCVP
jgi:hypothetical protein